MKLNENNKSFKIDFEGIDRTGRTSFRKTNGGFGESNLQQQTNLCDGEREIRNSDTGTGEQNGAFGISSLRDWGNQYSSYRRWRFVDHRIRIRGNRSFDGDSTKAKKANVLLAVITGNKDSVLAKMADFLILLPGDSKQEAGLKINPANGSLFEQLSFLVYDALVLELMGRLNQTSEQMYLRHANLE